MKKIYLFLLMCMFSLVAFAKGTGTGDYRVNAIDYQWNNSVSVTNGTKWYFVDITALDTIDHPAMSLTLTNTAAVTANVTATVYIYNGSKKVTEESRSYVLETGASKDLNTSMISLVKGSGYDVYVCLTCDATIDFEADLSDNPAATENSCANSENFDWGAGNEQKADTSVWYVVDLSQAKAQGKDIEINILNQGSASATIDAYLSYVCPTSGVTSLTRVLGAGATLSKKILYSAYASMGDELYVMVSSTQDLFISASLQTPTTASDNACLGAVAFDLENGNLQAAGDTWYAISMDDLRASTTVPSVAVENKGTATAQITFELSFDCPTIGELQSRTIMLSAGDTYEKTIGRDLINSVDASVQTAYIHVVSTQPLYVGATFAAPNAGESCDNPVRFNWVNGNKQAAGSSVWYMVDLSGVNDEAVLLSLINNAATTANVTAAIAFDCPVSTTVDKTTVLGARQTQTRQLANSFVKAVNNGYVYVLITTDKDITIRAELVSESATLSDCDLSTAIEYDWASIINITAGTQWYYVSLDTLRNTYLAPEVVIKNLGTSSATITAELAFACPTGQPMAMTSRVIGAGQEVSKLIERSVIDNYAGVYDYAYVRVTTTENLLFSAKLKDPNTGEDCAHAVHFDWDNGNIQEADTVWYIVDLSQTDGKGITLQMENLSTSAEEVQAELFFACDGELVHTTGVTLGGRGVITKDLGTLLTGSLVPDSVFIRLTTGSLTKISASLYDVTGPEITACADAMDLLPNIYYHLGANKDQWYKVDVNDLRTNTQGDAVLTINNQGASNALSAEVVWACPTTEIPTVKNLSLTAGEEYSRVLTRELINNLDAEVAYLHISTEDTITFRYVLADARGNNCADYIDFNWSETTIHPGENGNFHPMDSTLWYRVNMDTLRVDSTKDLVLHIENMENASVAMNVQIWGSCDVIDSLASSSYTLAALESKERVISNALVSRISFADLFVRLSSNGGDVHIWTSLTESIIDTTWVDPIDTILCDGAEFAYFDSVYTESVDTVLYYTVEYNPTSTTIADSIYTYNVHFLQDPQLPVALTNMPSVVCGKAISVAAVVETEIADSVAAQTYVAAIDSIWWEKGTWSDRYQEYTDFQPLTTDLLPLFTDSVALRYGVLTSCETITYSEPIVLEVAGPCLEEILTVKDTVCVGTEYIPGHVVTDALTEWTDTVYFYNADHTQQGDSIITYVIYTYNTQLPAEIVTLPTLQAGKAVELEEATADLIAQVESESVLPASVDTVVWTIFDPQTSSYVPAVGYLTSTKTDSARLKYAVYTECDTLEGQLTIAADSALIVRYAVNDSICYGSTYDARLMSFVAKADTAWNDTITFSYAADQLADSIYLYNITVNPVKTTLVKDTICYGDSYTFGTRQFTTTGVYVDALETVFGCDSVVTLELFVSPEPSAMSFERVLCQGETATILGKQYTEAGLYRDTVWTTYGCVSQVYEFRVIVNPVRDTLIKDTICYGETYVFGTRRLTQSGTYVDYLSTVHDCDSTVTLNLFVSPAPVDSIWEAAICDGTTYDFNGAELNETGVYLDTIYTDYGCIDRLLSLTLTVNPVYNDSITYTICQGDTFTFAGTDYTEAGVYTANLESVNGCDSIVTLTLNVNDTAWTVVNDTLCLLDALLYHNLGISQSGTYYEHLQTINGCDSTVEYRIIVLAAIQLPELTQSPLVVCGQPVHLDSIDAELSAWVEQWNADLTNTAIVSYSWKMQENGAWVDVPATEQYAAGDTRSFQYEVQTACGDWLTSDVITTVIEAPSADNTEEYNNIAASNKYDNWLLMINLNALKAQGYNPTEDQVYWYKVVDEVDVIGEDGGNDEFVGNGYYYTLTEALTGEYYALVVLNAEDQDACVTTLRTVVLTCSAQQAISIAPTALRPGETITVSNLDTDAEYVISVFDTKGVRVADYSVSGTSTYQFTAEGAAGYYVLKVNTEDQLNSFKYIIK